MKRLISVIILLAMITALTACNPTSEERELYFFELDEMREIVSRLKANGSEVRAIPYFDCEEYGYDVKFSVRLPKGWSDGYENRLDYFNRKIDYFSGCVCWVFFEQVDLDLTDTSQIKESFDCISLYRISKSRLNVLESPEGADDISIYIENPDYLKYSDYCTYRVVYNRRSQFTFSRYVGDGKEELSEEHIEIFEDTIAILN